MITREQIDELVTRTRERRCPHVAKQVVDQERRARFGFSSYTKLQARMLSSCDVCLADAIERFVRERS